MCGVRITLSRPRSSEINSSSLPLGSAGNTSIAAPPMWPDLSASARAGISTTVPRAALMNKPPFFIFANSAAAIMSLVSVVSGTCKETMSDIASSSSIVST